MGNVMHQSMTHQDEKIIWQKRQIQPKTSIPGLAAPQSYDVSVDSPRRANAAIPFQPQNFQKKTMLPTQ